MKKFGKKIRVIGVSVGLAAALLLASCENFANGSLLKDEIQKEIDYANSSFLTLSISADSSVGTTVPVATVYKDKYKATDKETISFTPKPEYQFLYWQATPSDCVEFDDVKSLSTTVKFLKETDGEIIITPVCAERPYPTVSPDNTGDYKPKNTPITISFDQIIQNPEEDLGKIDIQISGESILSHYKTPVYTNENRSILFEADDSNLIDLTNGTKTVSVVIPANFYYTAADGTAVYMNSEVTSTFTIDYKTKDSAVIALAVDDTASGKLNKTTGNTTFYTGEEFTLIFTMEDGYQFGGWNVSLAEGVDGTIETKTDDDGTTRIYLNETAILEEVDNDEDFDEEYYASLNKYQKIYRVLSGARDVKISPVCYKRPEVTSVTPSNDAVAAKNSAITITFSKKMNITDDDLKNITITMDGMDASGYFKAPVKSENATTGVTQITFTAKKDNLIDASAGKKSITVTVPQNFYYSESDGTKVTLIADYSYSYSVNNNTVDKINLSYTVENGTITDVLNAPSSLNLGESYTVSCTPDEGYEITGWKIYLLNKTNAVDETCSVSEEVLVQKISADNLSVILTAKDGVDGTVVVKPVCSAKKSVTISVSTEYGTTIPAGNAGTYYSGDTVSLDYREDSDYQFINWNITKRSGDDYISLTDEEKEIIKFQDKTNENGTIQEGSESMSTTISIGTLTEDYTLKVVAECAKRPKVVSATPSYDTAGSYRDSSLVVFFDQRMSDSSIYWTAEELTAIGKNLSDDYKITGRDGNEYYYGYKDGENVVFKNITITNFKDTTQNLLSHFQNPAFDSDGQVLRIKAKLEENAPPEATEILVGLNNSFEAESTSANLTSEYSWVYFTNNKTDTTPPNFNESTLSVKLGDAEIQTCTNEITAENTDKIREYKRNSKTLTINASVTDTGSGPDNTLEITVKQLECDWYPVSGTAYSQIQKITSVPYSQNINFNTKIDLTFENDGLYQIDLTAMDKNSLSVTKTLYFVHDENAPDVSGLSFTENRNTAAQADLSFTTPSDLDFACYKVITTDVTDESLITASNPRDVEVEGSKVSVALGTARTDSITNLKDQHKYQHSFVFYDYAGNSETINVVDNTAPDVSSLSITENRNTAAQAELSFTTPSDLDFACYKVITTDITDESLITASNPRDIEVEGSKVSVALGTARTDSITNLKNQHKYQHSFVFYDYAGNASEAVNFVDNTAPDVSGLSITENRKCVDKTYFTFTTPDIEDIASYKITTTDITAESLITDTNARDDAVTGEAVTAVSGTVFREQEINSNTNLKNQHKYQHSFVFYDFDGNASEPVNVVDNEGPISSSIERTPTYSKDKIEVTFTKSTSNDYSKTTYSTNNNPVEITANKSTVDLQLDLSARKSNSYCVTIIDYDYSGNSTSSQTTVSVTPAVGMIYYSDGYWSTEKIDGKTPIGVICSVSSDNIISILELENNGDFWWGNPEDAAINYKFYKDYSNHEAISGLDLYKLVVSNYKSSLLNERYNPRADYMWSYLYYTKNNSGNSAITWYSPTVDEWSIVHDNIEKINPTLSNIGTSISDIDFLTSNLNSNRDNYCVIYYFNNTGVIRTDYMYDTRGICIYTLRCMAKVKAY